MNVLQLISSIGFFGSENMVLQISRELKRRKNIHPVLGIILNLHNPHAEVADEGMKNGIETVTFPCRGKFDFQTLWQLRRFIKERKIDVIHSHGYKSNLYAFFSSIGFPVFLVSTCHNWVGNEIKMKSYEWFDRLFLRRFDKVATVSEEVQQKVINSGISEKNVRIIPNGISIEPYAVRYPLENVKGELDLREGDIVIGTVGRISPEKNHRLFLKLIPQILERHPKTRFLIVGDGPLKKDLEKEFRRHSVIFTGVRRDIPELYQCMDIFVLPSLTEGLPMVLLEAMASKLPVVASSVGAISDVVVDGETGLLVNPGDQNLLLASLLYLLDNPVKAVEMGVQGASRVRNCFSSEKMTNHYIEEYRTVMKTTETWSYRNHEI